MIIHLTNQIKGRKDRINPAGVLQILGKCYDIFLNTGGVPLFNIKKIQEIALKAHSLTGSLIINYNQ